jgi:hypothetical protein
MHTLNDAERFEFWSNTYGGRSIAIFNREGRWHVYIDHVLQHNVLFATAADAIAWLTRRIDHSGSEMPSLGQEAA